MCRGGVVCHEEATPWALNESTGVEKNAGVRKVLRSLCFLPLGEV